MLSGSSFTPVAMSMILVLMAMIVPASPAGAHAVLVASEPRDGSVVGLAPRAVVLRFNVRIEQLVTQATLVDERGRKTALKPELNGIASPDRIVIPLPPLQTGNYRIQYRVLAADGHASPGMLRFTVTGKVAR